MNGSKGDTRQQTYTNKGSCEFVPIKTGLHYRMLFCKQLPFLVYIQIFLRRFLIKSHTHLHHCEIGLARFLILKNLLNLRLRIMLWVLNHVDYLC